MRVLKSIFPLVVALTTVTTVWGSDDGLFWMSTWDKRLPAMKINDVALEGESIAPTWKEMCSKYFLRCNLYMKETPPAGPFSFTANEATGAEVLDTLTAHFGYTWSQHALTGVIWIYPQDMELIDVLGDRIEVSSNVIEVPMHSGILEPLREALPWGKFVTKAWSDSWLATFDYPVSIPKGTYTLREILNLCCLRRPAQAYLVNTDKIGTYATDVNLSFSEFETPTPGSDLFWQIECSGVADDRTPSYESISEALRSGEQRTRWAAQNAISNSEELYFGVRRRISQLPVGEAAVWEILGVASATNQRPDRIPVGDLLVSRLKEFSLPNILDTLSPEAACLVVLYTFVFTRDDVVLEQLGRLKEIDTASILSDIVRSSNFTPGIARALFDEESRGFIGDKLVGLPKVDDVQYHRIKVRVLPAD